MCLTHGCGIFLNKAVSSPNRCSRSLIEPQTWGNCQTPRQDEWTWQNHVLPAKLILWCVETSCKSHPSSALLIDLFTCPHLRLPRSFILSQPGVETHLLLSWFVSTNQKKCRWMLCYVCFGDGELRGHKLMVKGSGRREEEVNGT